MQTGFMFAHSLLWHDHDALVIDSQVYFPNPLHFLKGSGLTGSSDDIEALAKVCHRYKMWIHVEGQVP